MKLCSHPTLIDKYYKDKSDNIKYDYSHCVKCGKTIITDGKPISKKEELYDIRKYKRKT